MCTGILPQYMSVHHLCAVPKEARRGRWIPMAGVIQPVWELLCGRWELILGSLKDQPVLSTTEPPFQPQARTLTPYLST